MIRAAIQSQKADGDAALSGQGEKFARAKFKVVLPVIEARVEQGSEFSGVRIDGRDVAAFEAVAHYATQGEILHGSAAAVLHGDHVIDFVLSERESL